jgi:hypothetical protein
MSWEKMEQEKQKNYRQKPYRIFYLSSIATILTIGFSAFFKFRDIKKKMSNPKNYSTNKASHKFKDNIFQTITKWLKLKKKK